MKVTGGVNVDKHRITEEETPVSCWCCWCDLSGDEVTSADGEKHVTHLSEIRDLVK